MELVLKAQCISDLLQTCFCKQDYADAEKLVEALLRIVKPMKSIDSYMIELLEEASISCKKAYELYDVVEEVKPDGEESPYYEARTNALLKMSCFIDNLYEST